MLSSYDYRAFGELLSGSTGGNYFRYTGQQADDESGLYYLRARYYDPTTGRFLTVDPKPALNLYIYADNCPTGAADPSGEGTCQISQYARPSLASSLVMAAIPLAAGIIAFAPEAAAVGGGSSALSYTISSLASGSFTWEGLGEATAAGALGGPLGKIASGPLSGTLGDIVEGAVSSGSSYAIGSALGGQPLNPVQGAIAVAGGGAVGYGGQRLGQAFSGGNNWRASGIATGVGTSVDAGESWLYNRLGSH